MESDRTVEECALLVIFETGVKFDLMFGNKRSVGVWHLGHVVANQIPISSWNSEKGVHLEDLRKMTIAKGNEQHEMAKFGEEDGFF